MAERKKHTNIVLFGQVGAGKSSLVNLMAETDVAITSNDMESCTLHWKEHPIQFDGESYKVFDTVGLEEPQLGIQQYLDAIENAYSLIQDLEKQGGIDLLLFCMRAGRLNSTLRSNYRLFHEFLCDKKVPIVVVITHLEGEVREMDDWWKRNEDSFRRCGIHVAGHACITAIKDNYEKQYEESRTTIRKLVKDFAADGQNLACAPWNDPNGGDNLDWFVSFTCKLKGLLKGNWKLHAKKDVVPRLERCGMSRDIAKQLARRIKNVVVEGTT